MGRKRREDTGTTSSLETATETVKRARKENLNEIKVEKSKKNISESEKSKNELLKEATEKKPASASEVKKNYKKDVYTESSSSSDSECEKTSGKIEKKSGSDSNSDSDSESSDSDSSPTLREETLKSTEKTIGDASLKNSITNLKPVKSYISPSKSSSSDSYHSDTEEEDKKRRKKQKKLLQMKMTKKTKKSSIQRSTELKPEIPSDNEMASNNGEVPDWPESDYTELIRRMEAQIPAKDNQKFDSRAAKLDWSKVAFGEYSPEECMEVWIAISKRIRRFRTLHEILQDAKEWVTKPWTNFYRGSKKNRHPDMPARPLSTYMLYYLEQKDKVAKENPGMDMTRVSKIISEMYKNLSSEEKDKYADMAAKQRQSFDVKLSEFYKEHPEVAQQRKAQTKEVVLKGPRKASNPFKLFFQEQLKMYEGDSTIDKKAVEEEAKEKWKNLSDKKKLIWINWALEDHKRYEDEMRVYKLEHPDFVPPNTSKSVLNKDERNIKERLAGKPVKPPNSAYSLFSRVMLQSDPDVKSIPPKERMAEISRKWKEISETQKLHYEEKVRAMQEAYKLEFASYLEGLSPEEKEEELKKSQPKRKTSKAEQKAKKKALKNNTVGNKKTNNKNKDEGLNLFKGEPRPPPVRVFDVFLQSFLSERSRGGKEEDKVKEALKVWNSLSESKKETYRTKHEELKQNYIRDFEAFLKGLTPEELKQFSVMKELAKKNKETKDQREVINGATADSNEESEDDCNSSTDSESDDSDSGKSSKSSSSSEDSEC